MRGSIPFLILLIANPSLLWGAETGIQPSVVLPPAWVEPANGFPETRLATINEAAEGIYFVLIDEQVNVATQERYRHTIKDFVNENGVQNEARLTFDFDPSYEQLFIHHVKIQRGSNSLDRLQPEKIKVLQQERELERHVYNGAVSAIIFLEDVRTGDRVDYSYTVRGFNPIFGDHYIDSFSTQFAAPIGRERFRLLWPGPRPLQFQNHGNNIQPEIRKNGSATEYIWDQRNVPAIAAEDETPSWYDDFSWVQLSDFATWKDVAAWTVPLYPTNSPLPAALTEKVAAWRSIQDPETRLTAVLPFLQDEVRYLGFEAGTQSHRPADPSTVFERRFGDCKDKAYLFCAICRELGFEACPALVHTAYRGTVARWLPSPYAFNHVIARVETSGKIYWVDPTRSHQRGPVHSRYVPDYGQCLIVRPDVTALTPMPSPDQRLSVKTVHETFHIYEPGKPVSLTIYTVAEGYNAERLRAQTSDASQEELQKRFLNYYAREYPGIEMSKPLEVLDEQKNNRLSLIEHYEIKDFWALSADKTERECEFYPQTIFDLLSRPDTKLRATPLSIPFPRHEILRTEVILPKSWPVDDTNESFTNAAQTLSFKRTYKRDRLEMEYEFRSTTNCVVPRDVPGYLKSLDLIEKNLGYSLTWPENSLGAGEVNWAIVSLGAVYSVLVSVGGIALYRTRRHTPPVISESTAVVGDTQRSGLGGWLILIGVAVVTAPFFLVWSLVQSAPAYSMSTWHTLTTSSSAMHHGLWIPLLIFDLLANLTLLGCSVLLIAFYFQKRRTFPRLFIAFMVFTAIGVLADHFGTQFVLGHEDSSGTQDTRAISRAVIPCLIWVPYMLQSRRVKATFVR